jgi:hypothetical protein
MQMIEVPATENFDTAALFFALLKLCVLAILSGILWLGLIEPVNFICQHLGIHTVLAPVLAYLEEITGIWMADINLVPGWWGYGFFHWLFLCLFTGSGIVLALPMILGGWVVSMNATGPYTSNGTVIVSWGLAILVGFSSFLVILTFTVFLMALVTAPFLQLIVNFAFRRAHSSLRIGYWKSVLLIMVWWLLSSRLHRLKEHYFHG